MKNLRGIVYNMGPIGEDVSDRRARIELSHYAGNAGKPKGQNRKHGIALIECLGRSLPRLDYYHTPIHERASESTANLALYVHKRLVLGRTTFVRHKMRWPNIEHAGLHMPRATLVQDVEDDTWVVAHAPQEPLPHMPAATQRALRAARDEWLDVIVDQFHAGGIQVSLWCDPNGLLDELKHMINSLDVEGTQGEAVAVKGMKLDHDATGFVTSYNGIRPFSDHKGLLKFEAKKK